MFSDEDERYENGKIYKLVNIIEPNKIYVGSTYQTLQKRLLWHYLSSCDSNTKLYETMRSIGIENFDIELIEEYPAQTKHELLAREKYYINKFSNEFELLNTNLLNIDKQIKEMPIKEKEVPVKIEEIFNAPDISRLEYIKLKNKKLKVETEIHSIKRYQIINSYGLSKKAIMENKELFKKFLEEFYQKESKIYMIEHLLDDRNITYEYDYGSGQYKTRDPTKTNKLISNVEMVRNLLLRLPGVKKFEDIIKEGLKFNSDDIKMYQKKAMKCNYYKNWFKARRSLGCKKSTQNCPIKFDGQRFLQSINELFSRYGIEIKSIGFKRKKMNGKHLKISTFGIFFSNAWKFVSIKKELYDYNGIGKEIYDSKNILKNIIIDDEWNKLFKNETVIENQEFDVEINFI